MVNFDAGEAPAELGSVVEVLVEESFPHSLVGRRVGEEVALTFGPCHRRIGER
jgi:hypothetical protein